MLKNISKIVLFKKYLKSMKNRGEICLKTAENGKNFVFREQQGTETPLSLPHLSSPLLITKMRCRLCSYGNMKASLQLYASFGAVMKPHCINTRSAKMLNCFLGSFIFWQSFNVANSPQLLQWQRVFRSGFDKYYSCV